jgi:hypothetical protein
MKALSIRQPWAWLIVNGHKDIENRSWATKFRGPVLIHAAKGMTGAEYNDAYHFALEVGINIPPFNDLERGGIVGMATVTGCSDNSLSPWFFGKFGFELADAKLLPFQPYKGQLGFFDIEFQEVANG